MKRLITSAAGILLIAAATATYSEPTEDLWVSVGTDSLPIITRELSKSVSVLDSQEGVSLIKVSPGEVVKLSHIMHENFHRCGGFMVHDDYEDANLTMVGFRKRKWVRRHKFQDYAIDQNETVQSLLGEVDDANILDTILSLSTFHNRYYNADTGVESMQWIKDKWQSLAEGREDVSVELKEHDRWKQPSVILTITGTEHPDEIVVIGGHGDSINGMFFAGGRRAPGADDNASGIASITEVIRVLLSSNYKPKRTIQAMAYAAEEVGLRGSSEIATEYKAAEKQVVGVLQLDMTNYMGSEKDIYLYEDFTNAAQNQFVGTLVDQYLPDLTRGVSKCGYGCSDHASWSRRGYPASFPHEATMRESNKKIHSTRDTIEQSQGHAQHAAKFSKLGVAYVIEMAK
mgnify:CR=1 FL=1|jgi:bacterial leucyl aminopeptidase